MFGNSTIQLEVVDYINSPPIITDMLSSKNNINPLEEVELTCLAQDVDNDALVYSWLTNGGTIIGTGSTVVWKSPSAEGVYEVSVVVNDGNGGVAESKLNFLVKDYSTIETGNPIAYYPFAGNGNDISGNNLHGQVFGAVLTNDLEGNADNAYYFDGQNDYIKVESVPLINFTKAITISCWIRSENLLSGQESFILSHGSWQNRWKLSVNSGKLRWTLNTSTGIKDVDSSYGLKDNEKYHITATYDGTYAILYLNGKLDNYVMLDGEINTTSFDFLIGKMLTDDDNAFNYNGLIDEVLIYDYALTPEEAISLMDAPIITGENQLIYDDIIAMYPNPTTGKLSITLTGGIQPFELMNVYNAIGKKIGIDLIESKSRNDVYYLDFNSYPKGIYYVQFSYSDKITTRKIIVSK